MNTKFLFFICIFFSCLIATGCATKTPISKEYAPNEQLDGVLTRYLTTEHVNSISSINDCKNSKLAISDCDHITQQGALIENVELTNLNCHDTNKIMVDCFRLASELSALYLQYPNHKRILMASALVEFEIGNTNTSQQLLDILLSKRGAYPEAAILRSRIAMEDGNLNLARTIIKRQLNLTPYNPYLYEIQAAYYYAEGHYKKALQAIRSAELFLKDDWRISYHRGIIYEAQKQWYKACKEYKGVLKRAPNNQILQAKILLLRHHAGCYVNQPEPLISTNSF